MVVDNRIADIQGSFDGVIGRVAFGWAYCPSRPHCKLRVDIVEASSGKILADGLANQPREDLTRMLLGDGRCAFRVTLPFSPAQLDHVQARVEGVALPASRSLRSSSVSRDELDLAMLDPLDGIKSHTAIATANLSLLKIIRLESQLQQQSRILRRLTLSLQPHDVTREVDAPVASSSEHLNQTDIRGNLIVLSIIDWGFRYQRPQQLSVALGKRGYRVFYVNSTFLPVDARDPIGALCPSVKPIDIALSEISLKVPVSFLSDHSCAIYECPSSALSLWLAAQLRQLCSHESIENPTIIAMHPSWHAVCRHGLREYALIYDCMDYIAGFPETSAAVLEEERHLINDCDRAIVASEFLYQHLQPAPRVLIRNACDYDYFSSALSANGSVALLPSRAHNYSLIVGYYGAISTWFDLHLVVQVAKRLPNYLFALAGSTEGCDISLAHNIPNICFLGELPYEELVPFLRRCDTCIIPFKINDLIRATNPVKIYEYLAAGKPVVATPLPELKTLGLPDSFCILAEDVNSFTDAIVSTCRADRPELALQRTRYASAHTWSDRAEAYDLAIDSLFPSVTIVIICFNQLGLTRRCIDSILHYTQYPSYNVVLVDNGSTDGTCAYGTQLSSEYQHISFLPLSDNLGFPAACNRGIQAADSDVVVLMNNDTYVTPGWLFKLLRPSLRDPSIGLSGPLTNNIGNQQKINVHYSTMDEMIVRSEIFCSSRHRQLYDVDGLAFFCVLITRAVIDTVGLLDEGYGLGFFEDDDYCMRVVEAGFRIVICDDVFVHHELGGSFGRLSALRQQLMRDNQRRFLGKWGRLISHCYREDPGFG